MHDLIYDIDLNPPRESGSQKMQLFSEPKKKQTIWDQKRLLQGVHLRKSVWFIWSHIHPATTSHPSAPNRNLHIALPTWHLIAHCLWKLRFSHHVPRLSKAENRWFGAMTLFFWGGGLEGLFSRGDLLVSGRVYVYISIWLHHFQLSGFHPSEKTSLPWDDLFHQAGSVFS